jgi:hypothetical protein
MKNLFLVLVCVFGTSTIIFGQQSINTDELIGYWMPDEESTQLFFWKDVNGKLQMQEISGTNGEPLDLLDLRVNSNSVYAKTTYSKLNWVTENTFTLIDKETLQCLITGAGTATIIYRKTK